MVVFVRLGAPLGPCRGSAAPPGGRERRHSCRVGAQTRPPWAGSGGQSKGEIHAYDWLKEASDFISRSDEVSVRLWPRRPATESSPRIPRPHVTSLPPCSRLRGTHGNPEAVTRNNGQRRGGLKIPTAHCRIIFVHPLFPTQDGLVLPLNKICMKRHFHLIYP